MHVCARRWIDRVPGHYFESMTTIRRIRPGDGAMLRDVRLRALQTDPDAFGSSYEQESGRTEEQWERRAERAAGGKRQYLSVAEDDSRFVGLAGAYQPEEAPEIRELYGMWVAPDNRASGIGGRLVAAVEDWSVQSGAREIRLWVVRANESARRLYLRAGFKETADTQPLPSNPELIQVRMALSLR